MSRNPVRTASGAGALTRPAVILPLVLLVALGARLAALPGSGEHNMDPDGAHFLNVARCFERGQGFRNPGAWPAWMKPERLPMPETFKEPGYPLAIALLTPVAGGAFRAGVLISLLAGLALPFAAYFLARAIRLERDVAALGALLVAANPLSTAMSVRVMVDSVFPATLTLLFAVSAWRPGAPGRERPLAWDAAAGLLAGCAFLLRAQTLVALPAAALLLLARRPLARGLAGSGIALGVAILVALPFLVRNLRLFGVPIHSDVGAYGIWPYVDQIAFSHGLDRPPAPLPFALAHLPEVLRHSAASAVRFATRVLPQEILGNPVWMIPFAAGVALSLWRWRDFAFAYLYLGATLPFIFAVHWDSRYFTSTVPLWSLFAALGGVGLARAIAPLALAGPVRGRHLLLAALAALVAVQGAAAHRTVAGFRPREIEAARTEAPFLRERLRPDESAMVLTTSYWSWFADRPTVHLVIADEARFLETVRRLRVRAAALPTSRLAELAARYPGGRLPRSLVPDHVNPALDVTVFTVRDPGGAAP